MNALTPREHLTIWWSFIWRVTLFGGLAGLAFGAIAGILMNLLGLSAHSTLAGGVAGFACNLVATYIGIGRLLTRKLATFAVRIERSHDAF